MYFEINRLTKIKKAMAYNSKGVEYMRGRGAINDETDIFFYFGSTFEDGGKKVCYGVYKL